MLPFAQIDPAFTGMKLVVGIILLLTVWPLAVAIWFSAAGWVVFALLGKKWRFEYSFIVDDEELPNKSPEPTATVVTPPAAQEPRRP